MTNVTVAPITSTIKGLSSEVRVGPDNGLDHDCVVSLDNVLTVPTDTLGRIVGYPRDGQEAQLARAVVMAYDLEVSPPRVTRRNDRHSALPPRAATPGKRKPKG